MTKLTRPAAFEDQKSLPPAEVLHEIGRMALVAASMEDFLHALYWRLAKISDAVGSVITGDYRPNRLMEDIIKIAQAANIPAAQIQDIKDIFEDYKPLAAKRNQCIHWLWAGTENGVHRLSPPAYKPDAQPVFYTTDHLKVLADDLVWLEHRIEIHTLTPDQITSLKNEQGNLAGIYAPTPWLEG